MFDVVVIGAGPAGSAAAREIARGGRRVALLERGDHPGQRAICGGGIEGAEVGEIGLPDELVHVTTVRREHHFPWGTTTIRAPHVTTLRRQMDRWLAEQAVAAGAELFVRTHAQTVVRKSTGRVVVTAVDLAARREMTWHARLAIFADGPHTLAPRSGGLGFVCRPSTASVGLIYELEWGEAPLAHHDVHFGSHVSPWGYAWIFPKRGLLNVGVTILPAQGISRNMEARLRAFVESQPSLRGRAVLRRAGAHIPVVPAARIYDDSMLAVGDAGGMVDALTGAGIANAVASGRLAGQVACEALDAGDFSATFLARYQTRWQATPRYRMIRLQSNLTRAFLPLSRVDGNLYAKLMQVLFLGGRLSRWQKLRLLAYPLPGTHPTRRDPYRSDESMCPAP